MSTWNYEKLQHILGILEGHEHGKELSSWPWKTWEGSKVSPLADFETLRKQKVKAKAKGEL